MVSTWIKFGTCRPKDVGVDRVLNSSELFYVLELDCTSMLSIPRLEHRGDEESGIVPGRCIQYEVLTRSCLVGSALAAA